MSVIHKPEVFRNAVPVDDATQSRMDLGLKLLLSSVVTNADDLTGLAHALADLRERADDMLNDIALQQRVRGTDPHDIKTLMQRTCPVLACLYRIEAMADHRISNDQCAESKLTDIRDLAVQAIEERHGGPFTNPIYPERVPTESKAKRWRDMAEKARSE